MQSGCSAKAGVRRKTVKATKAVRVMILSRYTIDYVSSSTVQVPDETVFGLPEKVLQFGTGVLLRGLPDYFIDKANRQGLFNGRLVVVKSTAGDSSAFQKQDCLYTVCTSGIKDGIMLEERSINAAISRVLHAGTEWQQVLDCAHNPEMKIILSNTTEVGIQLVNEDVRMHPPTSFPGKLLAFLYERFKAFGGSPQSGMLVIPTELVPDNGKKLEAIVFELAHLNGLEDVFIEWMECCNTFCNSLVDRMVPGRPDNDRLQALENELGYTDQLLIVAEDYRLWAIEGGADVKSVLSFAGADDGIVIAPDIEQYRELKLRLLNATHTFTCGLAYLAGCQTVRQSMEDEMFFPFIDGLMLEEIAPSVPLPIAWELKEAFAKKVAARFLNPALEHKWLSIALNYTSKVKTRCVPLLLKHYEQYGTVPELMTLGFAAYLCFTRPVAKNEGRYWGEWNGVRYPLQDSEAPRFYHRWAGLTTPSFVHAVLGDKQLWDSDLTRLPGFEEAVLKKLNLLLEGDVRAALPLAVRA